jgi:hypothetical protein
MTWEHACAIWIPTFLFLVLIAFMQWHGKLPSVQSIAALASVTNSKGGNILVLAAFSTLFFFSAVKMIYWSIEKMIEGKLEPANAVVMMGLTFVTGSAFGGSFSSMLKAMSGEAVAPSSEKVTQHTITDTVVPNPQPPPKGV